MRIWFDCRSDFSVTVATDLVNDERVVPDGADVGGVVAARVQGERAADSRLNARRRRWNFTHAENAAAQESVRAQLPHALPLQLRQTAGIAGEFMTSTILLGILNFYLSEQICSVIAVNIIYL